MAVTPERHFRRSLEDHLASGRAALGPEGGSAGGKVVFQGTPEMSLRGDSHTCTALSEFLRERGNPVAQE